MDTHTQPETARLTADVVVVAPIGTTACVLLIRRGWPPYECCWALPGGHVDTGETTHTAAVRELAEETSLDLTTNREAHPALPLVGVYSDPGRDPRGRYVTFAYLAEAAFPPDVCAADDATAVRWAPVTAVLSGGVPLAFDHHRIVTDAARLAGHSA